MNKTILILGIMLISITSYSQENIEEATAVVNNIIENSDEKLVFANMWEIKGKQKKTKRVGCLNEIRYKFVLVNMDTISCEKKIKMSLIDRRTPIECEQIFTEGYSYMNFDKGNGIYKIKVEPNYNTCYLIVFYIKRH